jgi:hypothetical protein
MDDLKTRSGGTSAAGTAVADAPGNPVVLGVATTAVALGMLMVTAHDMDERLMMAPVIVGAALLVWGLVVPRGLRSGHLATPALWLSALALPLTVVAFWAHVPFVLATGGAYLGWVGRGAQDGAGRSIAALVMGLLAMVGYVAVIILDALSI